MKFLLIVSVLLVALAHSQCNPITVGDQRINLGAIPPAVLTIQQVYQGSSNNYYWAIDPCATGPPTPEATGKVCAPRGFVEEYSTGTAPNCEQSFSSQTTAWAWNGTAVNAVFNTRAGWQMNVGIVCTPGTSAALQPLWSVYASGSSTIVWGMQLSSSAACPVSGPAPPVPIATTPLPSGMTYSPPTVTITVESKSMAGAAFVIIVFVGAFLYVVLTMLYNRFRLGKSGKELAPHPEFWLSLPGLVKDGHIFVFRKLRGLCKKDSNAGGYTSV